MNTTILPMTYLPLLQYPFNNPALLELALTHPSTNRGENYERLEFLGDAVLGVCIADMLYHMFPAEREGALAKRKAALVSGETLTVVAQALELGAALQMSDGEEAGGGRRNASNLENALEAVLGAIYLDSGLEAVRKVIEHFWRPLAEKVTQPPKDARSALQEWLQARGMPLPKYKTIQVTGEAHAPQFTIEVTADNYQLGAVADGSTKRTASSKAAARLLEKLQAMEDKP